MIEDEESEGRTRSLAASLSYGFAAAFSDPERRILALLHLFQGFVDVDALRAMGDPEVDGRLSRRTVRGLTREAGIALLDRAAEAGLLTALGGGYYTIHPALPWFFNDLFDARLSRRGRRRTRRRNYVQSSSVTPPPAPSSKPWASWGTTTTTNTRTATAT